MAKKNEVRDRNVQVANFGDLCTQYMKIFGANTNLMRHIPSAVDGIKPGERRILYAMFHDMGLLPTKDFKKISEISGKTMSEYHPHGDSPINDTIAKLTQDWVNSLPLIEGDGNFGSPMGDKPAGARYIKARLSYYAYKCFFDGFSLSLVDAKPTYNGNTIEPEFLPSRYPNALINNTFGIGYGISCGLPTYNFTEVCQLAMKLIDNPHYENTILIPDSPTGADIIDEGQFEEISKTGRGKFKMRAVIEVDEENNQLIITRLPMQVLGQDVLSAIITLGKEDKIQGLIDVKDDYTEEEGIKYRVLLKKEIDPMSVRSLLYTKTDLEKTYPVNFKLIDEYQDIDFNVTFFLLHWIDFRRETKRRYYNHNIIKMRERQHTLETLLFVFDGDNAEKALGTMRNSKNKKASIEFLMSQFGISSLQADGIANMPMHSFTQEAIAKYRKEKADLDENIRRDEKIVRSGKKIDAQIKAELEEGIKLFGGDRRSKVISLDGEVKVRNTNHLIVFTLNGLVKKLPADVTSIGFLNQGDYPVEITHASNLTDLLIFDQTGKISKLSVHLLQNSDIDGQGEPLSKYCTINGKITSIIPKPTADALEKIKVPVYFIMITKNGIIKKTTASNYSNIKGELVGMQIKDGDELKSVKVLAGDKDVLVYTNKGFGVRFPSADIRDTARNSIGVKAIEMSGDELVIGMDIINEKDAFIFCMTDKGTGKKCPLSAFQTMDRASKPLRITSLEDNEEVIFMRTVKGTETFKVYLKSSVEELKMADVSELTRLSKGKKLIGVRKGDVIIDIKEVK